MGELADLYEHVLAEPDDDGPRIVYADALTEAGDPRGELIATQCALAAAGIDDVDDLILAELPDAEVVRLAGLLRRANQLFAQHADAWKRELFGEIDARVVYRRGLPHQVRLENARFDVASFFRAIDRSTVRSLFVPRATDDLLVAMARLPRLRRLDLFAPRPTDPNVLARMLASLPDLEELAIFGEEGYKLSIDVLAPLHRLVDLALATLGLDRAGIDALARLPAAPSLRRLDLHNARSDDDTLLVLDGRFPALADVKLHLCRLGRTPFAAHGPLQIPRVLSLEASWQDRASLASFLDQPTIGNLEELDLSSNFIGDAVLGELARCDRLTNLRSLDVDQGSISDASIVELANSASARLSELHIRQTGVTARGLAELLASDRHALRVLDCWPTDRARDGRAFARAIAEAPRARSLRELRLHACGFDDEDVVLLASSPHLASVRHLDLTNNHVNNTGARALARSSRLFVRLCLWDNWIREDGQRAWPESPALVEIHTCAKIDDPEVVAALRARFGAGFSIGRDAPFDNSTRIVFPGPPPVTPAILREVIEAMPELVIESDDPRIVVRDPRLPETRGITIRISHDDETGEGQISLAYRMPDEPELRTTIDALASAIVVRTGGSLYDPATAPQDDD